MLFPFSEIKTFNRGKQMKNIIMILTALVVSVSAKASTIRCAGFDSAQGQYLVLLADFDSENKLFFGKFNDDLHTQAVAEPIEFKVSKIENTKSTVEMSGTATNVVFAGGGSQDFELLVPKIPTRSTVLVIKTNSIYNNQSQAFQMNCANETESYQGMINDLSQVDVSEDTPKLDWFQKIQETEN